MLAGNHDAAPPKDLHKLIGLSAEQASNFCGQCHRTWAEIALQGNFGYCRHPLPAVPPDWQQML